MARGMARICMATCTCDAWNTCGGERASSSSAWSNSGARRAAATIPPSLWDVRLRVMFPSCMTDRRTEVGAGRWLARCTYPEDKSS